MKYLQIILLFLLTLGLNAQNSSCESLSDVEVHGINESIVVVHYPIYEGYDEPFEVLQSFIVLNGVPVVNRSHYHSTLHYIPTDCTVDAIYMKYEMRYDSNGDGNLFPDDEVICFETSLFLNPCNYIKPPKIDRKDAYKNR